MRVDDVEVLILDKLSFVPFDRTVGELLFNVIADRYQRKSVMLTSNLSFSEWPKVFAGDEKLTTALLPELIARATAAGLRPRACRHRDYRSLPREVGEDWG